MPAITAIGAIGPPDPVVGLFPGLSGHGGIQAAAGVAWRALLATRPAARAVEYAPGRFRALAKARTLLRAVTVARDAGLLLVWHVAMLKLLAFVRPGRAKVVAFLHGVEAWRRFGGPMRFLLRRVHLFLANSEHTWRRFAAFNPDFAESPHRIVPLGIGAPCVNPPGAEGRETAALALGRLLRREDYKGHRELIQAWPRVLARMPRAQLWIAGDGDLRPELETLARTCGVADRVAFMGFVSEAEKEELLRRSRCLALPSRDEGFGLVYLEAMRVGTPCLVSTVDAGREVVNPPEAGLAADPRDPEQLAEALCGLLTPGPEWDMWSRRARERYERQYTAAHFQRRLLEALAELWHPAELGLRSVPAG